MSKKLQKKLKTASVQDQSDQLLSKIPDNAFCLDKGYRYIMFSELHARTMKKIWGVSIKKGLNMLNAIGDEKDRRKAKKNFDLALKGKHFTRIEEYGNVGQRKFYEDRYGPLKSKNGKITGLYVWVIDFTRYKKVEDKVNHYSSLLSSSLESVNHGILVVDKNEKIVFRNQKFLELWRIPTTLINQQNDWAVLDYAIGLIADQEKFLKRVKELYANPREEGNDLIELKDGRVLTRYTRPHFLGKKIVGRVWSFQDVTTQNQIEKEIRHLASFPQHNPEIVIEITRSGELSYGNPAVFEVIRKLNLPDHKPFIPIDLKEFVKQTAPWKTITEVTIKGCTFNEKIFYLPEKDLIRIYAFDLTERVEAEKQKTNLELTYKTLFESATDAILMVDMTREMGKIVSANPAAATMHGYSITEFLQLNIRDIDAGGSDSISFTELIRRFSRENRINIEVSHFRKDGSVFPLEVVASLIEISGEKFMLAIERDISLRRENEEDIRQQYKFIESLVAASPDVVYVYDLELDRYVYGNERLAGAYGHPLEDLLNKGHSILMPHFHPDDVEKIPDWIEKLNQAKDGEVVESQFRLRQPNGSWRTLRNREAVFMRNTKGRVKQFIGTSLDITEQLAAQQALLESESRFRALHEASFGGIAIHDQGKIVEANAGLARITGYSYEELIGLNGLILVHPDDRPMVMEKIKSRMEEPYDARGLRKDGSVYFLEIKGKAIPYRGNILRVTEFRDITERHQIAEKIKEQNARLQSIAEDLKSKNEQLDEFTQIVSHNLRAPAGNIVSLSEFLMIDQDHNERVQTLELLKQSGKNILTTLSELNEVLKIKQSDNLEKRYLEFEAVFLRTYQMLNAHISNVAARVERNFDEAPGIEYPHIYLESIFLNLLSNALKYSSQQRVPYIKFKTYNLNGRIALEVSDNGLGINLERYSHQIFKMRKTFHNHPDSRGIGLFMIKNQIEAMGGQITVASEVNVGTTFRVVF